MKAPTWEGPPAEVGDLVRVRNYDGDTWFSFICKQDGGHLYLAETEPGQVRELARHGGTVIPYRYPGVLKVWNANQTEAVE